MTNQRVILTMVLTSVLSGYIGWSYAKKVDPFSGGTIQIHGLSWMEGPPESDGTGREQLTPTMAIAKCKIKKFRIDPATDGMEQAVVVLGDLSSNEFQCLLDESQAYVEGEPPPSPFSHGPQKPSYRPLYVTFQPVSQ